MLLSVVNFKPMFSLQMLGGLLLSFLGFSAGIQAQAPSSYLPLGNPGPGNAIIPGTSPAPLLPQTVADPAPAKPVDPELKAAILEILNQRENEKKQEDNDKKQTEPSKGYELGSKVGIQVFWDPKSGIVFASENRDFRVHFGTVVQFDSTWWQQSPQTKIASPAGVGQYQDGSDFRRVRLKLDGTMWEKVEFNFVYVFEGLNQGFYDHMWAGFKDIPFLGTIRFGQHKVWQGMESIARNEDLPLMERSVLYDAFWQEFGLGIFQTRTFFDDRMTLASAFYRPSNFNATPDGAMYGNGQYAANARITGLPVYEENGRYLLHLGASYVYRTGQDSLDLTGTSLANSVNGTQNIVRFQGRADLRDAVGVGSPSYNDGLRALQGNNNRIIDTGAIVADGVSTWASELYVVNGPFSILAESTLATVLNAYSPATSAAKSKGTLNYWGSYIQASYFLTGESRGYDKRLGYYQKVIPYNNAWFSKGQDDHVTGGIGAWELLYRFEIADLNSGTVRGGRLDEHTIGLNWHINPNMRLMLNYTNAYRTVDSPNASGMIQGIGTRIHIDF